MMHQWKRRFVCALCALAMLAALTPTAAFAVQPAAAEAVQQSLTASDVQEMQQADDAVAALTDSKKCPSRNAVMPPVPGWMS